jgi:hypothetical protein
MPLLAFENRGVTQFIATGLLDQKNFNKYWLI